MSVITGLHRYKYKIVQQSFNTPAEFVKKMNKLGYHGWSILDIHRDESGKICQVVLAKKTISTVGDTNSDDKNP